MWFTALATDYDGTLATDGVVPPQTIAALTEFRKSGRKLLMVTGRRLQDLVDVFPDVQLFDLIVTENGAVLYSPATKETALIAPPPPPKLVELLQKKGVTPLEIGDSIVATWLPNESLVFDSIKELGLEHQVIFNKGAVMILPPGINKASGLAAALRKLGMSAHNVVGIGDAQNDLAFLTACECSVAVANALQSVQEAADITVSETRGAGVEQIMQRLIDTDLAELSLPRHQILLGKDAADEEILFSPRAKGLLIAGTSGSGKSTAVTVVLERLGQKGYQFALIDPEGDYENLEYSITVGNSQHAPTPDEATQHLRDSQGSVIVNLLGLPLADRPEFLGMFLPRVKSLRDSLGHPHWIIIDEAHHMLPRNDSHILQASANDLTGMIFVTVHPDEMAVAALKSIDQMIILGKSPGEMFASFSKATGETIEFKEQEELEAHEAFFWQKGCSVRRIAIARPQGERRRHLRKYAEGDVGLEKSFYFRGKDNKLNLRVQNLILFMQISEGLDDETWLYHLRNAEYSKWFAVAIKDDNLAKKTAVVEEDQSLSAAESKEAIHNFIKETYTASEKGLQLNSGNVLE
jgi:hydroxymethylpyrimidine pyrophosphatase-like HAD family hydrolase